ncbi:ABC transporter permease [Sinirhodobacter populi]|uniref:ABC transporter permease n=2 Tax=Paenirhodobacter populi TaxID=2306993 RepID=A0A443K2V3_9RHOB|nr:ABC transporter permease [Sinirhodobacter populi]
MTGRILLLMAMLLVVVTGFAIVNPAFIQLSSFATVLQFSVMLALVALGQAFVVMSGGGGIDLSVGGIVSVSSVFTALAMNAGIVPWWLVPAVPVVIGAALGFGNAVMINRLKILPLIATLGTYFLFSGLAMAVTKGATVMTSADWITAFGRGTVFGIPLMFLVLVVPAYMIGAGVLTHTSWGRWIYATGRNERAARLTGIPVDRLRITVYTLSGMLAGLAAFVSIAWFGAGRPNMGQNLEMESLTCALLGGVAIAGGAGGVVSVLIAVMVITTLKTGLQFNNISTVWQIGIVGALLLAVLLLERFKPVRKHS